MGLFSNNNGTFKRGDRVTIKYMGVLHRRKRQGSCRGF